MMKTARKSHGHLKVTMERIELHVDDLLNGQSVEDVESECDFSIVDQNAVIVAKGVTPSALDDFRPVLRHTVTYIVAAVVINDLSEILMMQEAKSSCAGTWYLPAGRMEEGETMVEAVKREVAEETGLDFEPTTLILMECAQGSWMRFVFTGNIVGGQLKTPAEADAESLQAKWVRNVTELTLRGKDILPLIEKAREYRQMPIDIRHPCVLPSLHPHDKQLLRVVVVARKRSNNHVHVVVSEKEIPHLPVCEINPAHSLYTTLKKFMQVIFPEELPPHKPHGLLSVEHCAKPGNVSDGLCLNLLISVRNALEDVVLKDGCTWLELGKQVGDNLLERVGKNKTVALNIIR